MIAGGQSCRCRETRADDPTTDALPTARVGCLEAHRSGDEAGLDQPPRHRVGGRRRAVDLLDQHAARAHRRRSARGRSARGRWPGRLAIAAAPLGQPCQQLPVAARRVRDERAVDENHGCADRSREPARHVRSGRRRLERRCRTGWPDRWPTARRSRVRSSGSAQASAADRGRRAARTVSRRDRRRSSRGGSGRVPPSPSAPGRPRRSRRQVLAAAASRVRMPCRFSSCWAMAVAHRRRAALRSDACTRLQRPSAVGGTSRRERNAGAAAGRFTRRRRRPCRVNARRAWNVSFVIDAAPDEVPQRVDGFGGIAAAGRFVKLPEERRAVRLEVVDDGISPTCRAACPRPASAGRRPAAAGCSM